MRLVLAALLLLTSSFAIAKVACLSVSNEKTIVNWKAYKTEKKIGVGGKFKSFSFSSIPSANHKALLDTASFTIDASSVDSKNGARDIKIAKHFFSTLEGGPFIKGHVISTTKDKAQVSLTLNGKTKTVELKYVTIASEIELSGMIDVLDFAMNDEFAALAKACASKHKGKTWSSVDFIAHIALNNNCSK
jgi:polyisoprenoid-binding protein YceI